MRGLLILPANSLKEPGGAAGMSPKAFVSPSVRLYFSSTSILNSKEITSI